MTLPLAGPLSGPLAGPLTGSFPGLRASLPGVLLLSLLSGCEAEPAKEDSTGESAEDTSSTDTATDDTEADESADTVDTVGENGGGSGGNGGEASGEFTSLDVRLSEGVATVVIVDWEIEGASEVWVEYGQDTTYGSVAPARAEPANRALILGVKPRTQLHVRAAATVGGTTVYSDDYAITTGNAPSTLPSWEITTNDTRADFGNWILTSFYDASGRGSSGVILLNRQGDVVWWTDPAERFMPAVRVARNGEAVLTLSYSSITSAEDAQLCRYALDGEKVDCIDTPYCHHDFVELGDGRVACLEEVTGAWRSYDLVGDAITLYDSRGNAEQIWNAFEDAPPTGVEDHWGDHELDRGIDWTHANGMWWDEASNDYFVSFYYWESVYRIDGDTGETEWVAGGTHATLRMRGGSFGPQHAPQWDDGTLYLFDNSDSGSASRLLTLSVGSEVTIEESFEHPDGRRALVMGDHHRLANGYHLSAWGDVGDLIVFDEAGTVKWQFEAETAVATCHVYAWDDIYALTPFP